MAPRIDFRSDTVTRPTPGMLEAMTRAEVGDDVMGDDPNVNALEAEAAARFGKEAAVFCPSGTMTNQIAIRAHTRPGDEVLCSGQSHIYNYEGGGIAANAGASVRLLGDETGRFTAAAVEAAIQPDDPHCANTALVAIEDTCNRGGGVTWDRAEIARIHEVCAQHDLRFHLDGARVFNRLVAVGDDVKAYAAPFDSISVCLSKGLGAPVGSLLIGSAALVHRARRLRKMMGGGMRQAGYLAAAGRYALEHHVERLAEDHAHARRLGEALTDSPWARAVRPPETNIVLFEPAEDLTPAACVEALAQRGLLSAPMTRFVRLVTHLDVDAAGIDAACRILATR